MADGKHKRGPGRPKGSKASEKQKSTNAQARAAAVEARKRRAEERKAELEKPRWKQLEDGEITVRDLTDEELVRGECANNDGTWEGRRHRLEPRMISRMSTEYKRRIRNNLDKLAGLAVEALEEILNDDEHNQRFQASKMVIEYQIGKVPDVVHVGAESEFDRLQQTAFRIVRGEDAVRVEEIETVPGEVVEE